MARKNKPAQLIIDEQVAAYDAELTNALAEMCRTIDAAHNLASMVLIEGDGAHPYEYIFKEDDSRFSKFMGWNERWMGAAYPRTLERQAEIEKNLPEVHALNSDVDTSYMDLCYDVQRFGFLFGYLTGCGAMGATEQELNKRASCFKLLAVTDFRSNLKFLESQRQRTAQEAKKAAPKKGVDRG